MWLYSTKEPDGMIATRLEKLGQFKFEIKHEARKQTPQAGCLSLVPTTTNEWFIKDEKNFLATSENKQCELIIWKNKRFTSN